jgi:hypothetical protein
MRHPRSRLLENNGSSEKEIFKILLAKTRIEFGPIYDRREIHKNILKCLERKFVGKFSDYPVGGGEESVSSHGKEAATQLGPWANVRY